MGKHDHKHHKHKHHSHHKRKHSSISDEFEEVNCEKVSVLNKDEQKLPEEKMVLPEDDSQKSLPENVKNTGNKDLNNETEENLKNEDVSTAKNKNIGPNFEEAFAKEGSNNNADDDDEVFYFNLLFALIFLVWSNYSCT